MTRMRKRFWRSWSHSNVEIGEPPAQKSSFTAAGMTVSNGMEAIMTGIYGTTLRRNVLPRQRVGELHSAVIVDAVFGIPARCGLHSLQVVDLLRGNWIATSHPPACTGTPALKGRIAALAYYANFNSIFFATASSFAIRKLRICPARMASGLDTPPAAPPFQRAFSMELSADRSVFASARVSSFPGCSATIGQVP